VPPPEPHYEKELHYLDFAEGPFPAFYGGPYKELAFH
jgi:hypothetical protein